jgi:hypothetical protein
MNGIHTGLKPERVAEAKPFYMQESVDHKENKKDDVLPVRTAKMTSPKQ